MNKMFVSPLLAITSSGPVSAGNQELVHLRQGDLDGACGPYCMVTALISLGLLSRGEAIHMDQWDGRTREGRFRDALLAFGALTVEGTTGGDLLWLTDFFKSTGLNAEFISGSKKQLFQQVTDAIEQGKLAVVGVKWQGGGAHWLLAVGHQGVAQVKGQEAELQPTHLLCLDPGQETPKTSLWNAVLAIFNEDGSSQHLGRMSSEHWGLDGNETKCQLFGAVVLSIGND